MDREQIVSMLREAGENYLSGEEISGALGVSRAAVWKEITALREQGYEIESMTRRGYRLVDGPDRLTEGEIRPLLKSDDAKKKLICLTVVDSTNTYAKKLAMEGGESGTAIVANEQTGGRGRRGNSFASPADSGVYLTMLWKPPVEPMRAIDLTSWVAVAVCDGIEAACGVRPSIKWTNDIILGGKKLCGILTEMSVEGESGALQYVVTGIGVNVRQKTEDFPEEIRSIAASLSEQLGHPVSRARVAAELINALNDMYAAWLAGTGDYPSKYRRNCITIGREVRIIRGEKQAQAYAEGLDENFGLIVRYPDGRRETITAGEVSVRGLFGYID